MSVLLTEPTVNMSAGAGEISPEASRSLFHWTGSMSGDVFPWIQADFVYTCHDVDVIDYMVPLISEQLQRTYLACPSPDDPDVPPVGSLVVSLGVFVPGIPLSFLSGRGTLAFAEAWERTKICLFNLHVWVRTEDDKIERCKFLLRYFHGRGGLPPVFMNEPVLVPAGLTCNGARCRYAIRAHLYGEGAT